MFYQIANVKRLLKSILNYIRRLSRSDVSLDDLPENTILYEGVYLPISRSNESLNGNAEYLASALDLVSELQKVKEVKQGLKVLDFGCGQGRLANGLILSGVSGVEYLGVDTNVDAIDWCRRWIRSQKVDISFIHLPAMNARYNPDATELLALPNSIQKVDSIFLNSVFSHMLADDVVFYLKEFRKKLMPDGGIYITAFIGENIPPVTENPDDYYGRKSEGALHRVVYEKEYFLGLLANCGYTVTNFEFQGIERTLQSVVTARISK